MKNGYYLSAYVEMSCFGNLYLTGHRHDNCLALWHLEDRKVTLVHYWELERQTGMKQQRMSFYDLNHFNQIVNNLLQPYYINVNDLQEIWGVPELNSRDHYLSKHKFPDVTYHAICHVASSLFMDIEKFKNGKILSFAVDGGADTIVNAYDPNGVSERDRKEFIGGYSENGEILGTFRVYTPAVIWGALSVYYGMQEGSLMALASASESAAYLEVDDFLFHRNYALDMDKGASILQLIKEVESLTVADAGVKFNYFDPRFSERDNKISMLMKIIQQMSIRIMKRNIDEAIKRYKINPQETYLAMSGGFALNCPCNSHLLEEYGFKGFIAPPCVSDSGMALGIGLYSFYNELGNTFEFKLKNAYYGDEADLEAFLEQGEYRDYIESVEEFAEERAVADIEEAPVIWFNGRAEIGPRALGARSILGDPRKAETKDRLNEVKQRQWWRPVAPIVLKEEQESWFEQGHESPYMLHAVKIRADKETQVPAVIHEDKTARVQTIDEETGQELLLRLLRAFGEKSGTPILCNTSLNDKGEPIVNRIDEAVNFALRKGIAVAYFNGKRVRLKNHEQYGETSPLKRPLRMAVWQTAEEREKLVEVYNPHHVSVSHINFCVMTNVLKNEPVSHEFMDELKDHIETFTKDTILKKQFLVGRMAINKKLQIMDG
jgi:predicted NodU family carbamoyl transferase